MVEFAFFWVLTSVLYIGSAIYVQTKYRDVLPSSISVALFCFGAAIFLSVNWRYFDPGAIATTLEALVLALLTISWVLIMIAINSVVSELRERGVSYA